MSAGVPRTGALYDVMFLLFLVLGKCSVRVWFVVLQFYYMEMMMNSNVLREEFHLATKDFSARELGF